jgi:hypothetical protein
MESTASKAFKSGQIDRRTYLHLVKGFSGIEADEKTDDPTGGF